MLDALRDADARATFFVLGRHAEQHPKIVERIVREGHEVANHTYSHGILVFARPREITRELLRTHRLLLASGARPPRLFRAPHGFRNPSWCASRAVSATASSAGRRACSTPPCPVPT